MSRLLMITKDDPRRARSSDNPPFLGQTWCRMGEERGEAMTRTREKWATIQGEDDNEASAIGWPIRRFTRAIFTRRVVSIRGQPLFFSFFFFFLFRLHAQIEGVGGGGKFAEQKDGIEPSTDGRDRLNRKEEKGKEDRKGVEKEREEEEEGEKGTRRERRVVCQRNACTFAQRRRGKSSLVVSRIALLKR